MNNLGMRVTALGGGNIKADAISVNLGLAATAPTTTSCLFTTYITEDPTNTVLDPTSDGAPAGFTACGGDLEIGANSVNAGGYGGGVGGEVSLQGDYYLMPLTSCECTGLQCVIVVGARDGDGVGTCDILNDVTLGLFVSETAP